MDVVGFEEAYMARVAEERALLDAVVAAADPDCVDQMVRESRRKITSVVDVWAFEGCDSSEVEEARKLWGGWLPASLEAYLLLFGRRADFVDVRFGLGYPALLTAAQSLQNWRDEMVVLKKDWFGDGSRFAIPDGAHHLGHRNGGRFFFVVDEVADPEVIQMHEGEAQDAGVSSTGLCLSEMILDGLRVPRAMMERSLAGLVERRA